MNSEGVSRVVSIQSAAAAQILDITPDTGCEWVVVFLFGIHDDTGNHVLNWRFTETNVERTGSPLSIDGIGAAVSSVQPVSIYSWDVSSSRANFAVAPEPIVLTHNVKATLCSDAAMGAAKKLYIKGLVCERRGVSP